MSASVDTPSRSLRALSALGAPFVALSTELRALLLLFFRTVRFAARGERDRAAIFASAYQMGNKSLFFLTVTMGFIGTILVFQSGLQAMRVVPDLSLLGATYLELLVRDLAASIAELEGVLQ